MNPFSTGNIQAWPTPIMFVGGPGTGAGPGSADYERDTEQGGAFTTDTETGDNLTVTE